MNAEMQIAESWGTNIKKNSLTSGKKNDGVSKTIRKQAGLYSEILHCYAKI